MNFRKLAVPVFLILGIGWLMVGCGQKEINVVLLTLM